MHSHDATMALAHLFQFFPLFRSEKRNDLSMRLIHRVRNTLASLAADGFQALVHLIEDRRDLLVLLGGEIELAAQMLVHSMSHEPAMSAEENLTRVHRTSENSQRCTG